MAAPRLFLSYSWSGVEHEGWVLQLATELRDAGVDVILDKWDLREGHDAHAFMERMVTDRTVTKVALICDAAYAAKADAREGGVGTEAQIITAELYARASQNKFVAVLAERDEEGKPHLPAYYASRIFIDLSDAAAYSSNYEQLLRWAFDKPLHQKPTIGEPPAYLEEASGLRLSTKRWALRAVDMTRSRPEHAAPASLEYFERLSRELEKLRVPPTEDPYEEEVVKSISDFLPYRNEALEVFHTLTRYQEGERAGEALHRLFEQLLPYLDPRNGTVSSHSPECDNFRFVVHELFLYAVAILIHNRRYAAADHLMRREYFLPGRSEYGNDAMVPYTAIRRHMPSFETLRQLKKRLSVRADSLKERCPHTGIQFRELMQADFVLYLRDLVDRPETFGNWWPETLMYASRQYSACEIFVRASSRREFEEVKVLLGVTDKEQLETALEVLHDPHFQMPRWQEKSFSVPHLLGLETLASKA